MGAFFAGRSRRRRRHPLLDNEEIGSIKCGANVDAIICSEHYETVVAWPKDEREYTCSEGTETSRVGANQEFGAFEFNQRQSSVILKHHPWVAKGADYLSLTRHQKLNILWDKIMESSELGG